MIKLAGLELVNLTKKFPEFTLGPLSLKVNDNEILVMIGPTGSGKTTFLNLICGLLKPDSGSVLVDGTDIIDLPIELRRIGYIFQNPSLFPHLSVYENIVFGLRKKRIANKREHGETNLEIKKLLDDLGILKLTNRRIHGLSGGEMQKISLARMLVTKPRIILMDEPLAHLDEVSKRKLRVELRHILKRQSAPTICVTHFEDDVYALADSVSVLQNGTIKYTAKLESALVRQQNINNNNNNNDDDDPITKFSSDTIFAVKDVNNNYLEGNVIKSKDGISTFKVGSILLEALGDHTVGSKVGVVVRPEDIILSKQIVKTSARNVIKATVAKITNSDHLGIVNVHLTADSFHMTSKITEEARADLQIREDECIFAIFKASSPQVVREE